jgi:hypothetical protein
VSAGTNPKIKELPPEEWDFRRVSKNELSAALPYEYARSSGRFGTIILAWLDSTFAGFSEKACKELAASGKNWELLPEGPVVVRKALEVLERSTALESGLLRSEFEAILPHPLGSIEREAADFAVKYNCFPTPWLQLPTNYREARINSGTTVRFGGVFEIDYKRIPEKYRWAEHGFYAFFINWDWSDKNLACSFTKWLKRRRPKQIRGKNRVGKGSATPFYRLKQLAAWRLSQAGYSSEDMTELIAKRKKEDSTKSEFDVLPNYTRGAWEKAIKESAELLEREDMLQHLKESLQPQMFT